MSETIVRRCKNCGGFYCYGASFLLEKCDCTNCHQYTLEDTTISEDDYFAIVVTQDEKDIDNILLAFWELKQKDIIEYELKMSQFRKLYDEKSRAAETASNPKCPTCGSTRIRKIGGLERAVSVYGFGLFSRKLNKSFTCLDCGYTW